MTATDYNYRTKEQRRIAKQAKLKQMNIKRVFILLSIFLTVNITINSTF